MKRTPSHLFAIAISAVCILLSACNVCPVCGYDATADSLKGACDRFVAARRSDSLRMAAAEYIRHTRRDGREYFRACRYWINADFLDGRYDVVMHNISEVERHKGFAANPDIVCEYRYTYARALQYARRYDEAVEAFGRCFECRSEVDSLRRNIRMTCIEAMLQMMNTYQSWGKPEECVEAMRRIASDPPEPLRDSCRRDMLSILAYAVSRTDNTAEAERIMDKALHMPLYRPTPARLFRDYAYAAAISYPDIDRQPQVEMWCRKALDAVANENITLGEQWVMALLGDIYKRTGAMDRAVELYERSIGKACKIGDLAGEANACNALAELFLYWHLNEQANEYADRAMSLNHRSHDNNPSLAGAAYLVKGRVMRAMERPDSALIFWGRAEQCYADYPYSSGMAAVDSEVGGLLIQYGGDSLQRGVRRLRRVVARITTPSRSRASACFMLAKGLIKQGRVAEGEQMLDRMYDILHAAPHPIYLDDDAYLYALKHYIERGNAAKIKCYAEARLAEADFRFNDNISRKVAEAMVAYQTEKKEQQLQLATMELAHHRLQIQYFILLSVFLLLLLVAGAVLFVARRRRFKARQQELQQQIADMIAGLQTSNAMRREAEQRVDELFADERGRKYVASVVPATLRDIGEARFREYFERLYPDFLNTLHTAAPQISRREEVMCMLILLGQTTAQIAETLCVSKSSVNIMRYRVRKKLQLGNDCSLDDVIEQMRGRQRHEK